MSVLKRMSLFALLMVTMAAATLHAGSQAAHAAEAALSWNPPTTYTDGSPLSTLKGYKIHAGTASGNYTQNIDVGNVTSYTMTGLNEGTTYYFAVSAYDTAGTTSPYSNQASFTTTAPPAAALYTVTASAGSGGSITPSGALVVSSGSNQTYTITPATGYKIAGVTVDGAPVGAVASYTFSNVTANHSIAAAFASTTTGTGSGTALTSSNTWQSQAVASQKGVFSATFDMTPNANKIDAATGFSPVAPKAWSDLATIVRFNNLGNIDARNGGAYAAKSVIPYSAGNTYRIRMVVDVPNHRYDVYVTSPGGAETQLAAGYAFRTEQASASSLNYLGVYAGTGSHQMANSSITSTPVTASYTLTATAGTGGSISPAGTSTVTSGGSKSYTIAPATGYKIAGVTVDGVSVGAVSSYSFSNVTANHTISATFAANTTTTASYTITATAYANGSISPAGKTTVASGSSKSYTITPNSRYTVSAVKVNGVSVGPVKSYTFSNVTRNNTIAVSFKLL